MQCWNNLIQWKDLCNWKSFTSNKIEFSSCSRRSIWPYLVKFMLLYLKFKILQLHFRRDKFIGLLLYQDDIDFLFLDCALSCEYYNANLYIICNNYNYFIGMITKTFETNARFVIQIIHLFCTFECYCINVIYACF